MQAARKLSHDVQLPLPPVVALIRIAALDCRTSPRHPVEACAILDPEARAEDHVSALVRALHGGTIRRMVFWQPGAATLSFDECWLTALGQAVGRGDSDSVRFLLARRIRPAAIPVIRTLMTDLMASLARR